MRAFFVALLLALCVAAYARPTPQITNSLEGWKGADIDCKTAVPAARKQMNETLTAQKAADMALQTEKPQLDAKVAEAADDQAKANAAFLAAQNAMNAQQGVTNSAYNALLDAKNALADITNACDQNPPPTDCGSKIAKAYEAEQSANKTYVAANTTLTTDKAAVTSAAADQKGANAAYAKAVADEKAAIDKLNAAIAAANSAVAAAQANLASVLQQCPQAMELLALAADIDCKTAVPAARKQMNETLTAQKAADMALQTEKPQLDAKVAEAADDQAKANAAFTAAQNAKNAQQGVTNSALNALLDAKNALADITNACDQNPPPKNCGEKLLDAENAVKQANNTFVAANKTLTSDEGAVALAAADQKGANAAYTKAVADEKAAIDKLNAAIAAANSAVAAAQANLASVLQQCPQAEAALHKMQKNVLTKLSKMGRKFMRPAHAVA